jgi:hypothetical protein
LRSRRRSKLPWSRRSSSSTPHPPAETHRRATPRPGEQSKRRGRRADQIEKYSVPEGLVAARREELTYLNHVVPGFQAFLAGDAGPAEIGKVRSIVARGRSHQSLARAALREAAAGR